jgi:hypothetical protein
LPFLPLLHFHFFFDLFFSLQFNFSFSLVIIQVLSF